jgi:hypothetical protein
LMFRIWSRREGVIEFDMQHMQTCSYWKDQK